MEHNTISERKKHKRKKNHVIIVTSDAVDANVKQFRIRPWLMQIVILILCVLLGAAIGYIYYEEQIWQANNERNMAAREEQQKVIEQLEAQISTLEAEKSALTTEKGALEQEITVLNDKIELLSETVNQKVQSENELIAQLEKQSMPTEFPLTGSASVEEGTEEDPICIFKASVGTTVVATASGTVTRIADDAEYGYCLTVDHGNGYTTVYRNKGEANVKEGDSVVQGTTLFIIGEDNTSLGYQIMKDGAYINPMDMLVISG